MQRAILVLLAAAALIVACRADEEVFQRPPTAVPPPSLEQVSVEIDGTPTQLVQIGGQLFAADPGNSRLVAFDDSAAGTLSIPLSVSPDLVAASDEFIYAWSRDAGELAVHGVDGSPVRTVGIGQELSSLHAWGGRAWGTAKSEDHMVTVRATEGEAVVIGPMTGAGRAVVLDEQLWVPLERELRIVGLDREGEIASDFSAFDGPSSAYQTGDQPGPTGVFAGPGKLWVAYRESMSVVAFRTNGTITDNLGVAVAPDLLAISDEGIFIASTESATVEYVDMRTLQRTTVELPGPPSDLLQFDGAFWLSIPSAGRVIRLTPV